MSRSLLYCLLAVLNEGKLTVSYSRRSWKDGPKLIVEDPCQVLCQLNVLQLVLADWNTSSPNHRVDIKQKYKKGKIHV